MTTLSDTFNRASGTSLGSAWTELSGDLRIINDNACNVLAGSQYSQARRTDDLAGSDHMVELKVTFMLTPVGNSSRVEVTARGTSGSRACYLGGYVHSTGGIKTAYIASLNAAGVISAPLAFVVDTITAGDVIRLRVVGNQLTFEKNSTVLLGPITDTLLTTGTRAGFTLTSGTDNTIDFVIDDWSASDLVSLPPTSPAVMTWTGKDLAVNAMTQVATEPAVMTWTGKDLVVNTQQVIATDPAALTWTGRTLSVNNNLALGVGSLAWTGQALAINAKTQIALVPADLTWTGQNTTTDRWKTYPTWTIPTITNGQVTGPSFGAIECIAVDRSLLLGANQWASVLLTRVPSAGVVVRASNPDAAATLYGASAFSPNGVLLFAYVAGVYQEPLAVSGPCTPQGQRLYLDAFGNSLTVSLADPVTGVETIVIGPMTTSLIPGGGYAGIATLKSDQNIVPAVDNYAAGDFSIQQGGPPTDITPADLSWTGQDLLINAVTAVELAAMALAWTGQSLSFPDNPQITLDPMRLTWTGQSIPGTTVVTSTGGRRIGVSRLVRA